MLSTHDFDASGEPKDESDDEESIPLEERFPEETAEWQERVEQAEKWKVRASRRWKK